RFCARSLRRSLCPPRRPRRPVSLGPKINTSVGTLRRRLAGSLVFSRRAQHAAPVAAFLTSRPHVRCCPLAGAHTSVAAPFRPTSSLFRVRFTILRPLQSTLALRNSQRDWICRRLPQ